MRIRLDYHHFQCIRVGGVSRNRGGSIVAYMMEGKRGVEKKSWGCCRLIWLAASLVPGGYTISYFDCLFSFYAYTSLAGVAVNCSFIFYGMPFFSVCFAFVLSFFYLPHTVTLSCCYQCCPREELRASRASARVQLLYFSSGPPWSSSYWQYSL